MKKFLFSLLLMLPFVMMAAQSDPPTALVVWMQDGSQTTFLLSKTPRVTVDATEITVTTTDGGTATLKRAEVHKYTLGEGQNNSVAEPKAAAGITAKALVMGDQVQITGLQPGAQVSIFTIDGRTVANAVADAAGRTQLSLSQQGAGIYLIITPSSSIKILKK